MSEPFRHTVSNGRRGRHAAPSEQQPADHVTENQYAALDEPLLDRDAADRGGEGKPGRHGTVNGHSGLDGHSALNGHGAPDGDGPTNGHSTLSGLSRLSSGLNGYTSLNGHSTLNGHGRHGHRAGRHNDPAYGDEPGGGSPGSPYTDHRPSADPTGRLLEDTAPDHAALSSLPLATPPSLAGPRDTPTDAWATEVTPGIPTAPELPSVQARSEHVTLEPTAAAGDAVTTRSTGLTDFTDFTGVTRSSTGLNGLNGLAGLSGSTGQYAWSGGAHTADPPAVSGYVQPPEPLNPPDYPRLAEYPLGDAYRETAGGGEIERYGLRDRHASPEPPPSGGPYESAYGPSDPPVSTEPAAGRRSASARETTGDGDAPADTSQARRAGRSRHGAPDPGTPDRETPDRETPDRGTPDQGGPRHGTSDRSPWEHRGFDQPSGDRSADSAHSETRVGSEQSERSTYSRFAGYSASSHVGYSGAEPVEDRSWHGGAAGYTSGYGAESFPTGVLGEPARAVDTETQAAFDNLTDRGGPPAGQRLSGLLGSVSDVAAGCRTLAADLRTAAEARHDPIGADRARTAALETARLLGAAADGAEGMLRLLSSARDTLRGRSNPALPAGRHNVDDRAAVERYVDPRLAPESSGHGGSTMPDLPYDPPILQPREAVMQTELSSSTAPSYPPVLPLGLRDGAQAAVVARQVEAARRHLLAALTVGHDVNDPAWRAQLLGLVEQVLTAVTEVATLARGALAPSATDTTFPGEARFLCVLPWERVPVSSPERSDLPASVNGVARLLAALGYDTRATRTEQGVLQVEIRGTRYSARVLLQQLRLSGAGEWMAYLDWSDTDGHPRSGAETLGPAEVSDDELARRVDDALRRRVGPTAG